MKVGLSYSQIEDSYQAGKQAAEKAISESGSPVLTIFFATFQYNSKEVFRGIKEAAGDSKIIGTFSDGVIVYDNLLSKGVGVLTLSGSEIQVQTFALSNSNLEAGEMGKRAGETLLKSGLNEGLVVIFFDRNFLGIYKSLNELYNVMGPGFKYVGGGSKKSVGDLTSYMYTEDGISEGSMVAALIGGVGFSVALGHGFTNIEEPLVVTKSYKNRILEFDGMPAAEVCAQRVGKSLDDDLLSYMALHPLGFPNLLGNFLIRDPVKINPDKSISFSSVIHKGAVGYIMEGDIDGLIKSSELVAKRAIQGMPKPGFGFMFNCISRYWLMGDNFKLELEVVRKSIGWDVPMVGMLTWEEIGNYKTAPLLHNKTILVSIAGDKNSQVVFKNSDNTEGIERANLPNVELSILHEIASFSFSGSQKEFAAEVVEKFIRLLATKRSALLKKARNSYELFAACGFHKVEDVLKCLDRESENQMSFSLGEDGKFGILYLEMNESIKDRERRICTIFAKRLEEIFAMIENIEKRKKAEKALRDLALVDELTKLFNRRGFITLGRQHLKLSERLDKKSVLFYIDVDGMKFINDNLGHSQGDEILIEIASILKSVFRKADILARIGGDEFACLGLETGENSPQKILERINKAIELRNKKKLYFPPISLSIGVATFEPRSPVSLESLLEEADKKMYLEKKEKKNNAANLPYLNSLL